MKVQSVKILSLILLSVVCLLYQAVAEVNPDSIRQAIISTIEDWSDGKLVEEKWPEAIIALNPIEIYSDRVNAVIVLSREYGFESGIYVYVPISSHLPRDGNGWKFTPIVDGAWDVLRYTRNIGEPVGVIHSVTSLHDSTS